MTAKPSFTIEKQQKVAGETSYTTAEKTAEVGQSVNYLVVVKNTGNIGLKFSALKDAGCSSILPSGTTELAPGKEESFTCSHTLTSAGTYTNEASIEGNEGTGTKISNKVTVKITAKPAYTIEKLQRLAGESAYNKTELSGKFGQKVEYKIIVKNTGNVGLKFSALKDSGCENISPSGATEVLNGKEESFTCEHTLSNTGAYSNEASIENTEGAGNKTSNKVTVTVKTEPNFSIEKLQKIGAEGFTNETRTAAQEQTIEYKIIVKNTGNTSLTFSSFLDEHCDGGTLAGGPSGAVKPGESFTYTCSHVVTATDLSHGSVTNEASITGSEGTGTKKSNKVEMTAVSACGSKKQPYEVDARWHYSAGGSPGNWSNTGDIVCGKQISFGPQAMEGEQRIKPGTEIKGGWDFKITRLQNDEMERRVRRRPHHLPSRGLRKRRNAAERTARNQAARRDVQQRLRQRMVPERRTVQRTRVPGQSHDPGDLRPARRKQRPARQELLVDHRRRRDLGRLHDPEIGSWPVRLTPQRARRARRWLLGTPGLGRRGGPRR